MTTPTRFLTAQEEFVPDMVDNDLQVTGTIVSTQDIPQSFLDRVAHRRAFQDSKSFAQLTKGDDLDKVHLCSIPVAIVNQWARQGFDMLALISSGDPNAAATILAKLRAEDLTAFQTTTRNF
jgi:hypothetical protein